MADVDSFLAITGLQTPLMLQDANFRVWSHYEVYGMPTAVLVDSSGQVIHEYGGRFDADDVLQRVASSGA